MNKKICCFFSLLLVISSLSTNFCMVVGAKEFTPNEVYESKKIENRPPVTNFDLFLDKLNIHNFSYLTEEEQNEITDRFLNLENRKRNPVAVVLGAIAAAITIGKGLYGAGKYAAKQCHTRGWLTKKSYKKKSGLYYSSILATFGLFVANGFDDYMFGR